MSTPNSTYADRLAAYGYTAEQAREISDENRRKMAKIAAVDKAGVKRGTVDRNADVRNFRNA